MGINAAFAIGQAGWPMHEPSYITSQNIPTFSFFEKYASFSTATSSHEFVQNIASVFASLSKGQEALGADFEAVWDANVDELYQA